MGFALLSAARMSSLCASDLDAIAAISPVRGAGRIVAFMPAPPFPRERPKRVVPRGYPSIRISQCRAERQRNGPAARFLSSRAAPASASGVNPAVTGRCCATTRPESARQLGSSASRTAPRRTQSHSARSPRRAVRNGESAALLNRMANRVPEVKRFAKARLVSSCSTTRALTLRTSPRSHRSGRVHRPFQTGKKASLRPKRPS